jgi:Na+-translocating ferredoxin:NAD+ oxidoreductase RnfA subunit
MKGVYSTSINESTLDESPKAYKSLDMVLPLVEDTCEIIEIIKPILNIKY